MGILLWVSGIIIAHAVTIKDTFSIAMVGDIMPGTTYPYERLPKDNGRQLFLDCESLLRGATICVANMEGVLCEGGQSTNEGNPTGYSFRIPICYVSLFKDAGIDHLCIANNHLRDFGPYGYERTMQVLDSVRMPYSGIKGYRSYEVILRDGLRFGVCSFGQNEYCYEHRDTAKMRQIVAELRKKCDVLICSVHGGAEGVAAAHLPYGQEKYVGENRGCMRDIAHFLIDCGADIIHGHGPHVPRAIELYKGRFIAYSLGNFCTPFGFNLKGMCGHAPIISINISKDGRFLDGRIYSMLQISGVGPRWDNEQRALKDIRELTTSDITNGRLQIDDNGYISIKTK